MVEALKRFYKSKDYRDLWLFGFYLGDFMALITTVQFRDRKGRIKYL